MFIPYTELKKAEAAGTPLTGWLADYSKKSVDAHQARKIASGWWGKPVGEFSYVPTAGSDWVKALSSANIGRLESDPSLTATNIPFYEKPIGQNGTTGYGYSGTNQDVLMSPQALYPSSSPIMGKNFKDIAIPLYGSNGSVSGYAVPAAYIQDMRRRGIDDGNWVTHFEYELDYDKDKLLNNAVLAKLPNIGEAFLFKDETGFSDVFGATPKVNFTADIQKPKPMSWFQIGLKAVSALGSFGGAASFADALGFGAQYASAASALGSIGSSAADLVGATGDVAKAISSGVNSAVSSGVKTALTGGDLSDVGNAALTGGLTSGAASLAGNTVSGLINGVPTGEFDDQYISVETASQTDRFPLTTTVAGGAAGAAGGVINAAITGGDIGNAAITGGVAGAAAGAVGDAGGAPQVGNAVGQVVGGIVNTTLQDDDTGTTATDTGTTATDTGTTNNYALNWGDTPSFASVLPAITRRPEWGTRLSRRTV